MVNPLSRYGDLPNPRPNERPLELDELDRPLLELPLLKRDRSELDMLGVVALLLPVLDPKVPRDMRAARLAELDVLGLLPPRAVGSVIR